MPTHGRQCVPFSNLLAVAGILAFALLTLPAHGATGEITSFTFVHISDSHIGGKTPDGKGHDEHLKELLRDVDRNFPEAAFIIHTGDVTEMGYVEEFRRFNEIVRSAKRKIHVCPGNHDVRWSESGKENFRWLCGKDYTSFDHNGVRFVLLDDTMLLQHYGHFDKRQMDKLKGELDTLAPGQPAVIAMHHPPMSEGHYIDNEYDFAELIRPYNVPLVCDGHGHTLQKYSYNGVTYAMGGTTYGMPAEKGKDKEKPSGKIYRAYRVTCEKIDLVERDIWRNTIRVHGSVPVLRKEDRFAPVALRPPEPSEATTAALAFKLDRKADTTVSARWTLDKVPMGALNPDADGTFRLIDRETLSAGWHQVVVEVAEDRKSTNVTTLMYPVNVVGANKTTTSSKPRIVREFALGSGSQAHPAIDGDMLYVAANDGLVRAFNLATGATEWERNLNREVVSSPVLAGDSLVIGSLDRNIYCLDRKTGSIRWKRRTGQAVMASAAIRDKTVYMGSGDCNLYALDLGNGARKWSFPAKRYIKMTPAFAEDRLFFGAWDNTIYSLKAATGELMWRVPASTLPLFSAATSNPVTTNTKLIQVTHDYSIRGLDQGNGSHVWLYKPKVDKDWNKMELGPSYCSPVLVGDKVYYGTIAGRVVAHNTESGDKVFDVELRQGRRDPVFDSSPRIVGDKLYICTVEGNLYCVDIPKASVAWHVALQPGFLFTTPLEWKGHILAASMGNKVFEIAPPGVD